MQQRFYRNSLASGYKLLWYEIKHVLGQGGFGITYLAWDPNLNQHVTIKEYLPLELCVREPDQSVQPVSENHRYRFEWGLERFINEGQTLAKFKHTNIVRVLTVFEQNHVAYMVMEYERGECLRDILKRYKTLKEPELLQILLPLLDGLESIHDAGFIHRDIKPANILIRSEGSPVLIDFGSARQALSNEGRRLTKIVSPGYAPFEQYQTHDDTQGPWSDIYAMAATLYRCIAGVVPMDAIDRSKVLHTSDVDPFVPALEVGMGRYTQSFLINIDHALAFNEKDRPQTLAAWRQEFDSTLAGSGKLADFVRDRSMEPWLPDTYTEVTTQEPLTYTTDDKLTQPQPHPALDHRRQPVGHTPWLWLALVSLISVFVVARLYPEKLTAIRSKEGRTPVVEQSDPPPVKRREPLSPVAADARLDSKTEVETRRTQQVNNLLVEARRYLQLDQRTRPRQQNALAMYRRVLQLDAYNVQAMTGIQSLAEHYAALSRQEMKQGNVELAQRYLKLAESILPGADSLRLTREKLHASAEKYMADAKLAIDRHDYRRAEWCLQKARQIIPGHRRLHQIKEDLNVNKQRWQHAQLAQQEQRKHEDYAAALGFKIGAIFHDELRDRSQGPLMVVLPGGRFSMGAKASEGSNNERPVHVVQVEKPFAMSRFEVNFSEYDRYARAAAVSKPDDEGWGRSDRPVINVTWQQAFSYAKWLSEQTGKSYRLPSEAEWEYAARAGQEQARFWGGKQACSYANVYDVAGKKVNGYLWPHHECDDTYTKSAPVGRFAANQFGLNDILGNVWEWTADCWNETYRGAPADASIWNEGACALRIYRGGSWASPPKDIRATTRAWVLSTYQKNTLGFRIVRDL